MKELKIEVPEGYEVDKEKSTFNKIIFKKIVLPKTWEEFCELNPNKINEYYISNCSSIISYECPNSFRRLDNDENLLYTKEDAEAHLALIQLHRLRDIYRQGWVPDWRNCNTEKYCIVFYANNLDIYEHKQKSHFLAFQSKEIAKEFLKYFKYLIEKAKDLI